MVDNIEFGFLTGAMDDAKNPLADAAFMAQIGAKLISEENAFYTQSIYELRNAATGTRFTFTWFCTLGGSGYSFWRLRKWNNL